MNSAAGEIDKYAIRPIARRFWWLERGFAAVVMLLLLRSSFAHFGNPYHFLSSVYEYQMVGIDFGRWLGLVLPFLQLTLAICILAKSWLQTAYTVTAIAFLVFLSAQVIALQRGMEISCGCFGASENLHIGAHTLAITSGALCSSLGGLLLSSFVPRPTRLDFEKEMP